MEKDRLPNLIINWQPDGMEEEIRKSVDRYLEGWIEKVRPERHRGRAQRSVEEEIEINSLLRKTSVGKNTGVEDLCFMCLKENLNFNQFSKQMKKKLHNKQFISWKINLLKRNTCMHIKYRNKHFNMKQLNE